MATPRLAMPYIVQSQAQKEVTHNEALNRLDLLVQAAVLDRTRTEPPEAPAAGACHIVGAAATGDWAGHDGEIAGWYGTAWTFISPFPGMIVHIVDEAATLVRVDGDWVAIGGAAEIGIADVAGLSAALDAKLDDGDAASFVAKTGDTMSGALSVAVDGGSSSIQAVGETGANFFTVLRADTSSTGPRFLLRRARGTNAAPTPAQNGDVVGTYGFQASYTGSAYRAAAELMATVTEPTPSSGAMGTRLMVRVTALGATSPSEVARFENETGLSMFGANVVVSPDRLLRLRAVTLATLSSLTPAVGDLVFASDLGGGGGALVCTSGGWARLRNSGSQTLSSDADASITYLGNGPTICHSATLTADRTLSLSTTYAVAGARFRVARTGAGAFGLSVGGLKSLATHQWCDVEYDGSAWILTAFGSL